MPKLSISIKTGGQLGDKKPSSTLKLQVVYSQIVEIENAEEEENQTIQVQNTISFELPDDLTATFEIDDYEAGTNIDLEIHDAQGIALASSTGLSPQDDSGVHKTEWALTQEEIDALTQESLVAEEQTLFLERSGKFIYLGETQITYSNYTLLAASYVPSNTTDETVKDFFGIPEIASTIKHLKADELKSLATLSAFSFSNMRLGIDGGFDISLPEIDNETAKGWLWILAGQEVFVGFYKDPEKKVEHQTTSLLLPPVENEKDLSTEDTETTGSPTTSPIDATEEEILRNPDVFSEDPGTHCDPFSNPNRILGERTFYTVLRVEQPEIGGEASTNHFGLLAFENNPSLITPTASRTTTSNRSGLLRRFSFLPATTATRVIGLVPDPILTSIRQRWIRQNTGRKLISSKNPIQWEGESTIYQASSVAFGHVLEHRMRWRSNGYSLGDVAKTLTLAPRQVKRISVLEWDREEVASRVELSAASDLVRQSTTRNRDYQDAIASSLSEWSMGRSKSSTTGAAGGIGFAMGPVVLGGGAAHGSSSSSSWQVGGRSVAASEHQKLRDEIRQFGASLRKFESNIIQEVSQTESVTGISEILRNPNYCHSLTVLYYQILRHLRVDTEIVGARECVFVPFSMKPFDISRVTRWRDSLQQNLMKQRLRWVMKHLEDLEDDFADSEIPAGPRSTHPVTFLSGSIYIKLGIERPRDNEDDDETFNEANWVPIIALLGTPGLAIYNRIKAQSETRREQVFQREYAPTIAAQWADKLKISIGGAERSADFTLASSYRYNGVVRVDFTYRPVDDGVTITRDDLTSILIEAGSSLSKSSVANVTRASIHYYTANFDRVVDISTGALDLITVETGEPDSTGAALTFQTSAWERQDMREIIKKAWGNLLTHLNEHMEYYHKVIWWNMDRDKIYMMLDGFLLPKAGGRSIASIVEREPVAILGNTLVFQVGSGAFLGVDTHKDQDALNNHYRTTAFDAEPLRISLPTDGLYAQALMDKCNACEEHFGSVDWVLNDADPELQSFGPEDFRSRRAEPTNLQPTEFTAPIINLQNAPAAPDPTGLQGVLNAVTTSDAFRDMAGLAGTQANAAAAMQTAASLASDFGSKAVDLQKSKQGTATAKQKLDSIQKAKDTGMISDDDAREQAKQALDEMNMEPSEPKLSTEPIIREVLTKAKDTPGTPISVGRGSEYVQVGGTAGTIGGGLPVGQGLDITDWTTTAKMPAGLSEVTSSPRGGADTLGIVLHFSSVLKADPADWPSDPGDPQEVVKVFNEATPRISAHYLISRDGTIYQLVDESRKAVHAGNQQFPKGPHKNKYANTNGIAIELIACGTQEEMKDLHGATVVSDEWYQKVKDHEKKLIGFTEDQYKSLKELIAQIVEDNSNIKNDRDHIFGHNELQNSTHPDPGSLFDWNKVGLA